jgi:hypothetical protein
MAPTTQEIPREAWRPYFDDLSKALGTTKATVEVDGRDIGAQTVAEDLTLVGVTYDDRDDVVVIGLDSPGGYVEEFEHMVSHPQRIMVATGDPNGPELVIDIEDDQSHQHIVKLEHAPELPPPR